jgi:hypothetical protein
MVAYNTNKALYFAAPTAFERMLERACYEAGTPLSDPVVLWDPLLPDRLIIARGTPYTPGKSDRMLYYAREYRLSKPSQPHDRVAGSLSPTRLKAVEEALIDTTLTPYDMLQSAYTAVQAAPERWELAKPNSKPRYVGKDELKYTLRQIVERYSRTSPS